MNKIIFAFIAIELISAITAASTQQRVNANESDENRIANNRKILLDALKLAMKYDVTLSPKDTMKRLEVLMKKMDYNQDNYIDRDELKTWILTCLKELAEKESKNRFTEIDKNEDGQITWHESLFHLSHENKDENIEHSEKKKMVEQAKMIFDGADLDEDGIVTAEEFDLLQYPEKSPQMLPIALNLTMHERDTNNDGQIDFEEFIASDEKHDDEWLLHAKSKFNDYFDKDKDGFLTGNEIESWIVPSNDEIANEEVDHLFNSTDSEPDNRLSYKEILNNIDTWVGSEATFYGEDFRNHFPEEL